MLWSMEIKNKRIGKFKLKIFDLDSNIKSLRNNQNLNEWILFTNFVIYAKVFKKREISFSKLTIY